MAEPARFISVVVPVYNECDALPELHSRIETALGELSMPGEIVFVDDASTDGSGELLGSLSEAGRARWVRHETNRGQFEATKTGLGAAQGEVVVVLDGDLQDPPETIVPLVTALTQSESPLDAVFAVKSDRSEGFLFRAAVGVYAFLLRRFGTLAVAPHGFGSYGALTRKLAKQVAGVPVRRMNLSVAVALFNPAFAQVPYAKSPRRGGDSRVGLFGLVREALGGLFLSGALHRIAGTKGLVFLVLAGAAWRFDAAPLAIVAGACSVVAVGVAAAFYLRRRGLLAAVRV